MLKKAKLSNELVTVIRPLTILEADLEDGVMYKVKHDDGRIEFVLEKELDFEVRR